MKIIVYNLPCKTYVTNDYGEIVPVDVVSRVEASWSPEMEERAKTEAVDGKYEIIDDGEPEAAPSQLDIIEAQVTYTAMMTDTLLEV